jgi:hypothetical protein
MKLLVRFLDVTHGACAKHTPVYVLNLAYTVAKTKRTPMLFSF